MTHPAPARAYASLLRRYQALVLDGVIYAVALVLGLFLPSILGLDRLGTRLSIFLLIGFVLLYEPLLVGFRGATIGHRHYRIRVVDARTGAPIGPLRAFGRGATKGILGLISLIFMLVTTRAQSLHDLLFHSIVVPEDAAAATALDIIVPVLLTGAGMPSRRRRAAVIMAYSLLTFVLCSAVAAFVTSPECMLHNQCSTVDDLIPQLAGVGWLVSTAVFLVAGWPCISSDMRALAIASGGSHVPVAAASLRRTIRSALPHHRDRRHRVHTHH
jgi:uncharacterized RDD family membrane protein YckC